jgi:hypothetical protein
VIAHFDTEFQDHPLSLASIGVVREDGKTFYRVAEEFEPDTRQWWFMRNVWKKMKDEPRTPTAVIAAELQEFLAPVEIMAARTGGDGSDEKLLRSLGCHHPILDLEILWHQCGKPSIKMLGKKPHHALQDAYHYKAFHTFVLSAPVSYFAGATQHIGKKTMKAIRKGKQLDFTTTVRHTEVWERRSNPNRHPRRVSLNVTGAFTTMDASVTSGERMGWSS